MGIVDRLEFKSDVLCHGSAAFLTKEPLLHLPAYRIGEESQNVDTVSFFMWLHGGIG